MIGARRLALFVMAGSVVPLYAGSERLFVSTKTPDLAGRIVTNPKALRRAAHDALKYFRGSRPIVQSALLEKSGCSSLAAEKTLHRIITIIDEDNMRGRARILDPAFLAKHFNFIRWNGDAKAAKKAGVIIPPGPDAGELRDGRIRITSYAIFSVSGSYVQTQRFNTPLYGLARFRVDPRAQGKSKVINDTSANVHKLRPLVWVAATHADDALMQGSIVVNMPDGCQRTFNVHRRIALKKDPKTDSEGLWLFREVFDVDGTCGGPHLRIMNHGGALFAGDLRSLGLGKLIALRYKNPMTRKHEIRLGVLADSGEAFKNNLYQLDIYAGVFDSRDGFKKHLKNLANTAYAYVLVSK